MSQPTAPVTVLPMDRYNQELVANLHPGDWVNPQPADRYNIVVIGGGTAGLVTAAGAALLGAKVALIEKHLLGGDCTNVGCVPSKAMIRSGRVAAEARRAEQFGIKAGTVEVDFAAVMERMRRVRATISPHDSAQRFQQEFGIDVFFGEAAFTSASTIAVAGTTLRFSRAAIATGSRPASLPIEGLEAAGYLTNETVFSLVDRPQRLGVIGGGYIGCELAQTFRRLGSEVVLLQRGDRILDREDADAAQILQDAFVEEGIQLVLESEIKRVVAQSSAIEQSSPVGVGVGRSPVGDHRQGTEKVIHYEVNGQPQSVTVDEILVGTGRSPNVENLGLEAAGVQYDKKGVVVNDYLQTTNPRIYAVGDVCMEWKFTHAADAAARIVVQNALFAIFGIGRKKLSSLTMPWCTYTDPEVAHVGLYPHEAEQQGIEVETFCVGLEKVDRAIVDGETAGFAKVYTRKGTDKIIGATIVARHAGEFISEITFAMVNNLGLSAISNVIYPYPTQAQVVRQVASLYSLQRLQAFKQIAKTWMSWRR